MTKEEKIKNAEMILKLTENDYNHIYDLHRIGNASSRELIDANLLVIDAQKELQDAKKKK